jgi:cytochrome c biogenesis protein CcdA
MPNAKTQRLLFFFGFVGVLTSCFGCGLAFNNQIGAAQVALIVAWLILVPLFGYLISTRRRLKKVVRRKEALQQEELSALGTLGQEIGEGTGDEGVTRNA